MTIDFSHLKRRALNALNLLMLHRAKRHRLFRRAYGGGWLQVRRRNKVVWVFVPPGHDRVVFPGDILLEAENYNPTILH